ncbi:SDR family NAD(P)-dependent oxidoreductase [Amycolatopsis sp. GM8]|uniref:SDR family NAD(P)-dependent oxidoreductase n=1 Tax=Amycolatopsis sp. GM8 TaxID=2896530 RepID=UPI001F27B017|nr:SDR family oxidoreductase [Amycolatopsis sp. GM8]
MGTFDGKVAIVSGATKSMGAELVRRLTADGAAVVGLGRSESGESIAREARRNGGRAMFVPTDLTSEEAVRRAVEATIAEYGRLDIIVNNAAASDILRGTGERPVAEEPAEVFDRIMKVNVYGPFYLAKYGIPHLVAAGGGAIVSVSSISAHRVYRSSPAYATSKAALEGLSRQIAMDYAESGVRSNVIVLGSIFSEETAATFNDPVKNAARRNNRMIADPATVTDVADLVAFLASPASRYMTAALVPLDGGALATYPGAVASAAR